ncbi:MAG: TonB-dependent receptor [Bacteroidota bacterium]
MKKLLLLLFLNSLFNLGWAQGGIDLTGSVQDSSAQALGGASVMLLQASDSVLSSFALTDPKGRFRLSGVKPGEYILQVSLLNYARYWEKLSVLSKDDLTLDPITLESEIMTLEAVQIETEVSPIRMKGDTLEYNAGSFNPEAGETVEDLLKRMPGMEVDREGNVEAVGEQVTKVLVDGKEFFGDDPQVATKNLPADAIDKVEVFDEKTDAEQFTGVDDGQKEQTINLTLKEDRKRGVFGNVEGGYGTDNRFTLKGNLNHFSPKNQLAVLGQFNNLNQQGFSFNDYIQFMGGMKSVMSGGGTIVLDGSQIPLSDLNDGQGLITSGGAGLNYNRELGDHLRWINNYFFSGVNQRQDLERYREQFLTQGSFVTEEDNRYESLFYNHTLNSKLRYFGDTVHQFTAKLSLGWNEGQNVDTTLNQTFDAEGNLENGLDRLNQNQSQRADANLNLSYSYNLGKRGRTISLRTQIRGEIEDQSGLLQSFNQLYPQGVLVVDSLRQDQLEDEESLGFEWSVSYNEPIGKKNRVGVSYEFSNSSNELDRRVFDLWPESNFNEQLSNRFRRDFDYHRPGIRYGYQGKKLKFSTQLEAQRASLEADLISLGENVRQQYDHLLPNARLSYELAKSTNLNFTYRTNVNFPTTRQLQPVLDNRNPFDLYQGNPDLLPAYQHTGSLRFNLYDQFNFISLWSNASITYTNNPVVEARLVDSLLRTFRTPVNVDNAISGRGYLSFSAPIRPLGLKFRLQGTYRFQQNIAFINNVANDVLRQTLSADLRLENRNKEKFDAAIGIDLSQNWATYSEASSFDRSFLNQRYYADLMVRLGEHWQIRSNLDWAVFGQEVFQDDLQIPLWSASLQRSFFDKRLRVELKAFDLLNRNQGLDRTAELNYLEEVRTQTLSRYVLLKIGYSIKSLGAQK